MPPEKPSRRTLLGGCLAGLLGWFGLGRQPAQAAVPPPPPQPSAEDSQPFWAHETWTTYDAEGNCLHTEYLPPRLAGPMKWTVENQGNVTTYTYSY